MDLHKIWYLYLPFVALQMCQISARSKASASLWSLSQLLHSISLILEHFCIALTSLCLVATFDCKVQIKLLNNSHNWMLSSIILAHTYCTPVKFNLCRLEHRLAIAVRPRWLCKQWKLHCKLSTWRLGHTIVSWPERSDHHHEKSKWVLMTSPFVLLIINLWRICLNFTPQNLFSPYWQSVTTAKSFSNPSVPQSLNLTHVVVTWPHGSTCGWQIGIMPYVRTKHSKVIGG